MVRAKKPVSIIAFTVMLGVFCVIFGGCQQDVLKAEVIIGGDGMLYIDIPTRKEYQYVELYSAGIRLIQYGKPSDTYWSIIVAHRTPVDFPLRYGKNGPGIVTEVPEKDIQNGIYYIDGFVKLHKNGGWDARHIIGKFTYYNGLVNNLELM